MVTERHKKLAQMRLTGLNEAVSRMDTRGPYSGDASASALSFLAPF